MGLCLTKAKSHFMVPRRMLVSRVVDDFLSLEKQKSNCCVVGQVYNLFRQLGLRHVCVIPRPSSVIGIITRKDLLSEVNMKISRLFSNRLPGFDKLRDIYFLSSDGGRVLSI